MDKLGIKGTLYDLLGYIMPGLFFLFALWLMYVNKDAGNLANTIEEVKKEERGKLRTRDKPCNSPLCS